MRHNLERIDFDEYIFQNFEEFLRQDGNHNVTEDGDLYLKEEIEFRPTDIVNRNGKIADQLWKNVITRHLYQLNYN